MPNVVVYVRASDWEQLEAEQLDPKDWVKQTVADALRQRTGEQPQVVHARQARVDRVATVSLSADTAAQAAKQLDRLVKARPLPAHKADPKDKARQEHGRGAPKTGGKLCPHRVPVGSYCKRCAQE